jgi:hypothetical protein
MFAALLADKAFDSNWIIEGMNTRDATIYISQRPQRREPLEIDEEMCKWQHLVENFFRELKDFRQGALRKDKSDLSFAAFINTCVALLNFKQISSDPRAIDQKLIDLPRESQHTELRGDFSKC